MFAPTAADLPHGQEGSSLPISTANLLCLLNIANFKGEVRSKYRFHENELQLQLDLQASTLVADLATKPELDELELEETIMAKDWFHLLLIRGEDLEAKGSAERKRNRLIVAFLSPLGKEMWREEGKRQVGYVWRSSAVQLQPELAMANTGGMSARVVSEGLDLRAHGTAVEQSTSIKVSMRQRLVDVVVSNTRPADLSDSTGTVQRAMDNPFQAAEDENALGLSEGASTLKMRLTDLKCYRMPGKSLEVTRWP